MIFITIGTQQQNFERLFNYVNNIETNEKIVIQKGKSDFKFRKGITTYDFLSYEEMEKNLKKARIVITHCGGGTIFKALSLNKKMIVVPRLAKYKEHINDHQLEFSKYLKKMNYCLVAIDEQEFKYALNTINETKLKKYISHEQDFINNVEQEIHSLLEGTHEKND